ncbi:MAG: hypothetical protein M3680_16065 [Myxococcota bacterium]|nr:hypothetical protein [Myxococcota bacterium]
MLAVVALVVAAVAAGGCFEDRYRCTSDAQCDVGVAGRCEISGACTSHDVSCPTARRYGAHAGELSGTCFDDRAVPANPCAGGQPAALPSGCFATVCERVPACCEIGWTDSCVQLAQEACDVVCDTRIALTAIRGMVTELWDLTWDGATWTSRRRDDVGPPLSWIGPAAGQSAPRLASTSAGGLVIDDITVPVAAGRNYQALSSVNVARDGRDTLVATYLTSDPDPIHTLELHDLERGTLRETRLPASQHLTWGDQNRDGFPDAVVKAGAQYIFLENIDGEDHVRKLFNKTMGNLSGNPTPGSPAIRTIDWLDLDGDQLLDLVVFGSSVRIHTAPDGLRDGPEHELDCDPPTTARACMADPEPNLEQTSFGGVALPTAAGPSVVLSAFPGRHLYRLRKEPTGIVVTPLRFPNDACSCAPTCTMCPGPNCSCTYDCSACAPILALVARDLDGDHLLDLVAIDAKLQLYTALAPGYVFGPPVAIPTASPINFFLANVSVSGAPR